MAVYTFSFPASAAGLAVTVRNAAGSTVDTGTVGAASGVQGKAVYTADLAAGVYVAEAYDVKTFYSSRATGVFDAAGATAALVDAETLPGQVLGVDFYGGANYFIDSTTLSDVDATNLAVTFNAPSSGNVLVRLTAYTFSDSGLVYFGIRESSSDVVPKRAVLNGTGGAVEHVASVEFVVTGLTPAAAHTYKFACAASVEGQISADTSSDYPAAVMQVIALP